MGDQIAKYAWLLLAALAAVAVLAGCNKAKPQQAGPGRLPPGVTAEQAEQQEQPLASLPPGLDEPAPAPDEEPATGVVGEHLTKAVLDSRGRLGGPYPNSTLAVFSPMLYDTAVERLTDVKLLQELLDNGSAVFLPNGTEVDYAYETQADKSFLAINYRGKRWYVKAEDATLKGGK